jgi:hypothetical protein
MLEGDLQYPRGVALVCPFGASDRVTGVGQGSVVQRRCSTRPVHEQTALADAAEVRGALRHQRDRMIRPSPTIRSITVTMTMISTIWSVDAAATTSWLPSN